MHGNTGSRAREHRLNIYHIFQDLDYHTIAFDYRGIHFSIQYSKNQFLPNLTRPPIYSINPISYQYLGYADSSRVVPTKTGVITDAKIVYDYVRDLAGESTPIIVHGHSLGAAVSTQAVAEMCREAGGINGDHRRLPAGYEIY